MKERVLDVGCGDSKVDGAVGIDRFSLQGVDIQHNLNEMPWPLDDNDFDRIIFSHAISHLDDICAVMEECFRILKKGGIIEIVAPHFSSDNFYTDPTHVFSMGYRSMNYFVDNIDFKYRYISKDKAFKLIHSSISFREASTSWRENPKFNILKIIGLEALVNMSPRLYEKFFSAFLGSSELYFVLKK
jgi:ubiquinone/menaquinone biosynthesis C-methylase UbiE